MKEKLQGYFRGPLTLHPILFVIFPVIFLYEHNIKETSPQEIVLPLFLSIAATILIWSIFTLILKSLSKAALATSLFVLIFFFYGRGYHVLETLGLFVPKHSLLLPTVLFVFGYCVYFIARAKRDFHTTTTVLNIIAVFLVVINIVNISMYHFTRTNLTDNSLSGASGIANSASGNRDLRDIYFIVLDEYARPDTMKEWYDYDNSKFTSSLKDKGFFIASQSKVRTPTTQQAIAQVLDMEYLSGGMTWDERTRKFIEKDTANGEPPTEELYQKISSNKVVDFLRSQGYSYVHFGSLFEIDRYDQNIKDKADLYFNFYQTDRGNMVNEFGNILWNTTIITPFYHRLVGTAYETLHTRAVLETLEQIKKIPDMQGTKFVFAHLNLPHTPFVFSSKGEPIDPQNYLNNRDKQFYLGQYIFASTEIEKVVDDLLKKSDIPPIIILQSDHGQRPNHPGIEIGGDEWEKVLNALYLPGMDTSEIPATLSTVNTFRLIFNYYFGANYPLLKDD